MALIRKRIIRPGIYSVPDPNNPGKKKRVNVSQSRIKHWAETHRKMREAGLDVPAPWRHEENAIPIIRAKGDKKDVDAYQNAGFWNKLWTDSTGALWGLADVRDEDVDKLNTTVKDVSLLAKEIWEAGDGTKWEDALTHIALVTHPVAKDNDGFEVVTQEPAPAGAIALSEADLFMADESGSGGNSQINAGSATVEVAIMMLKQLDPPIVMPDDTTSENFLERLVTVLGAIQAINESSDGANTNLREPGKNSSEPPGPIAMSAELDFAVGLLGNAKVINPKTGKPYTAAEVTALSKANTTPTVTLQMSDEDTAAVNAARKILATGYKNRIEACVKNGQIHPKKAKELSERYLKPGELRFSFDAEGNHLKGTLDEILETFESLPHGTMPVGGKKSVVDAAGYGFSLDSADGVTVEPTETEEDYDPDAVLDLQFAASGKSSNQIVGGYGKKK